MVRTRASEVSQVGRNTQGVTLMRVAGDEKLIAVERLDVVEGVVEADEAAGDAVGDADAAPAVAE
jgi:DNA gyrase subunit A